MATESDYRGTVQPRLQSLVFPIAIWTLSRLAIVIGVIAVAGRLPRQFAREFPTTPLTGPHPWSVHNLSLWDGIFYLSIVKNGYHYDPLHQSTAAFFPLLPLLMLFAQSINIDPALAGIIINNAASLVATIALYAWVLRRSGPLPARWASATIALLPLSVFTFVLYTEGIYLALTTLALSEFDRRRYWTSAPLGALASACRAPGILVAMTFFFLSVRERRGPAAYAASAIAALGLLAFVFYSGHTMHEPLAFLKAQSSWAHVNQMELLRKLLAWLTLAAAGILILLLRRQLPLVAVAYGIACVLFFLASGSIRSVDRFLFGTVTVSYGIGLIFTRYPRFGFITLTVCGFLLVVFAALFASGHFLN